MQEHATRRRVLSLRRLSNSTCCFEGLLEGPVRFLEGSVLRRERFYRRRLEGRKNTSFRIVRPPSRAPYKRGLKPKILREIRGEIGPGTSAFSGLIGAFPTFSLYSVRTLPSLQNLEWERGVGANLVVSQDRKGVTTKLVESLDSPKSVDSVESRENSWILLCFPESGGSLESLEL